jgi:type IV fimbrial biogenesis protein FimT
MKRLRVSGFTLIELMVTIVILAILVVLGFPSYEQWIRNTRVRNAAESIQNGLRLARNEATQRGANVEFYLPTAGTADWSVCQLAAASTAATTCATNVIQSFPAAGGAQTVQVTNTTALAKAKTYTSALTTSSTGSVIFTALGRPSAYGTNSILRIDTTAAAANSRRLVITISAGGSVRMCDPQFTASATSPQGCE